MSVNETFAALDTRGGTAATPAPATSLDRFPRWAPLAGVLFTVVFAIGFLTSADVPDVDTSGQDVIAHYEDTGKVLVGAMAAPIAAALLLFFAGTLRATLRQRGPEWLATVGFGGSVVYAGGLGLFAVTQIALLDAADLGQPEVAQALNILDNDNFMPVLIGAVVMLLATGWHAVTSRALPAWLGWVSLVLGVLGLAGPAGFVTFLLFPIWVLVVALMLVRRPTASAR